MNRPMGDTENNHFFCSDRLEKWVVKTSCQKIIVMRRNGRDQLITLKNFLFSSGQIVNQYFHAVSLPAKTDIIADRSYLTGSFLLGV